VGFKVESVVSFLGDCRESFLNKSVPIEPALPSKTLTKPGAAKKTRWPLASIASSARPRGFPALLGFEDDSPVPVRRRRVLPEGVETPDIKIEYIVEAKAIACFAASNNRLSSAFEIPLPVAR
jgi:hypothetical protein